MRSLTCLVAGVFVFGLSVVPAAAQFDSVGTLEFPASTQSAEAHEHFLRGVSILHSFGWKQAIEQFQAAQRLDPDFVMAYWRGDQEFAHHELRVDLQYSRQHVEVLNQGYAVTTNLRK